MSGSGVITQTPTAPAAEPAVRAAHDGTVVATTVLGAVPVRFGEAPAAFPDADADADSDLDTDPDSEPAAGLPSGSALLRTGLPVCLAGAFPMTARAPRRAAAQPLRAALTLSATQPQRATRRATRSVSAAQPLPATRSVPTVQSLSAAQPPKPAPTPPAAR